MSKILVLATLLAGCNAYLSHGPPPVVAPEAYYGGYGGYGHPPVAHLPVGHLPVAPLASSPTPIAAPVPQVHGSLVAKPIPHLSSIRAYTKTIPYASVSKIHIDGGNHLPGALSHGTYGHAAGLGTISSYSRYAVKSLGHLGYNSAVPGHAPVYPHAGESYLQAPMPVPYHYSGNYAAW